MDSNKLQMNLTVFILLQLDTVGMTGPDNMQQRGINCWIMTSFIKYKKKLNTKKKYKIND